MSLPKIRLSDVDETSLTITWDNFSLSGNGQLHVQYKLPNQPWEGCKQVAVNDGNNHLKAEIDELEPGTPYCVRLVLCDGTGKILDYGSETVFDTAPVNCAPKNKTCIVM